MDCWDCKVGSEPITPFDHGHCNAWMFLVGTTVWRSICNIMHTVTTIWRSVCWSCILCVVSFFLSSSLLPGFVVVVWTVWLTMVIRPCFAGVIHNQTSLCCCCFHDGASLIICLYFALRASVNVRWFLVLKIRNSDQVQHYAACCLKWYILEAPFNQSFVPAKHCSVSYQVESETYFRCHSTPQLWILYLTYSTDEF